MVCLTSLVWPRPLMFYIGRQFSVGEDPAKIAEFNALWQHPRARHTLRVMTLVWAIGWIGEFALRIAMVLRLSIPEVLNKLSGGDWTTCGGQTLSAAFVASSYPRSAAEVSVRVD